MFLLTAKSSVSWRLKKLKSHQTFMVLKLQSFNFPALFHTTITLPSFPPASLAPRCSEAHQLCCLLPGMSCFQVALSLSGLCSKAISSLGHPRPLYLRWQHLQLSPSLGYFSPYHFLAIIIFTCFFLLSSF